MKLTDQQFKIVATICKKAQVDLKQVLAAIYQRKITVSEIVDGILGTPVNPK